MLTPVRMPGFIREYYGLPKAIYILFIGRIVNRMGDFVGLFFGAGFVVTPWISGIYIDAFGTASIWFWVAVFSMLIAGAFLLLRKPAIRTELVPPEKVRGDAG